MSVFPATYQIDWTKFIHQRQVWPSASKHELVDLDAMHPSHALSAYRKLVDISEHYRDTSLAYALLEYAVGQRVIYADDVPESADVPPVYVVPTLPECFDVMDKLVSVMATSPYSHPVSQAMFLRDLLTVVAQGGSL